MPLLEAIIGVVAPHRCIGCGREGSVLCKWCQPDFVQPVPSRCYVCRAASPDFKTCQKCRHRSSLRYVWVRTDYESRAKELLHALKFERNRAAASAMAELMHETLPYFDEEVVFVHVPTATGRMRQRGYDQAQLLAKELAKTSRQPHMSLLHRYGQTRQVGRRRKERLEQLQDSFWVRPARSLPKRMVLVDDVITTGATLETAARALKRAGARHVDAIVFAQAL